MTQMTNSQIQSHVPVMLREVLNYLKPVDGDIILDCTFGAGGYSTAILEMSDCKIIGVDQDPTVESFVKQLKNKYQNRFDFINSNFAEIFSKLSDSKFNGIVMDLGVSSMQLDSAERGFSFSHDGPLDMRMNNSGTSAAEFINSVDEKELADIIYKYGDEVQSRRIAKKIVLERTVEPILTTHRLAQIVRSAIGFRKGKIDSSTKTFQAIRIYINNELGQLENFLEKISSILLPGGRLVFVSFHSLEDSLIKHFLKNNSSKTVTQSKYSKKQIELEEGKWLKILTKKPISPADDELRLNPRSRSAKLRAAIKIEESYVS
jgi:16S rRNA (cytosine1402-N4)-methyltransferase